MQICRRAGKKQRVIAGSLFAVVLLTFFILYLAGSGKIDLERFITPCGFKQRFNLPCPTCGFTTASIAFSQGKVIEAFFIQPAAALFCTTLAAAAFLSFIIAVFGVYFRFLDRLLAEVKVKHLILAGIVIISAGWAVTLARAAAQQAH